MVDKNYKRGHLTLNDLKILINQKEVDWNKVKRTFREEPVYSEINGQRKQIGNEYTIVISELDQTKREGTNTLDYSGIITVAINAGLIEDESGNTNNSQIITLGISQKIWDKITTYISSKNIIGSKENQKFTIAYLKKYKEIREYNAKVLFDTFYTKKARQIILKESGYLATENLVAQRAAALMTLDVANGVLDEFYRFRG